MKTFFMALGSLILVACSGPGDRREYDYLLMHYEADPDNETDPEHVLKAFSQCLGSEPVTQEWEAEKTRQGSQAGAAASGAAADGAKESERIAAAAMQPGSKLQALVDRCMTAKGYRTVR